VLKILFPQAHARFSSLPLSINTTNRYATIDLEMKRDAINKAQPLYECPQMPGAWRADASILTWLESL